MERYKEAVELYGSTALTIVEICRRCSVSVSGFSRYVETYRRDLLLKRNGIRHEGLDPNGIKIPQRRGQRPETHFRYREAIQACGSMEYIDRNVSEIAREFGLDGSNLARQLYAHYPDILRFREEARQKMGLADGLPRGSRPWCREQYAEALEMLRNDRYVTVMEVAERCEVSYAGLEQHLLFYHKELVDRRIDIREKAVRRKDRNMITGHGTLHAPRKETVEQYAEALELFRTTSMSVRKIAAQTGVPLKGFYEYLHTWHLDLVCRRKGIAYEDGMPVDLSKARKYNPATRDKYAEAIEKLRTADGAVTVASVAAEFGLHPETFRQYLKEHEPQLHAARGMVRTDNGKVMAPGSKGKYEEALQAYSTTTESIKSLARRFGFNDCAFGQFIRRHFPDLHGRHQQLVRQSKSKPAK